MSDEINDNPSPENGKTGDSASAIFAAIMREAAEKARPKGAKFSSERATPSPRPSQATAEPSAEAEPNPAEPVDDNEETAGPAEPQRFRRISRAGVHQSRVGSGLAGGFLRTIFVVGISAGLVATVLTWFTDPQFLNPAVVKGLQLNDPMLMANIAGSGATPTPVATPNWHYRIGIISGHRGQDSGAVCTDEFGYPELQEVDINFSVAQRVVAKLKAENFTVDLLDENDPRLDNYQGVALVSIHANTCYDFGEFVSGYIVAKAEARPDFGNDTLLRECVALNFGALVPLERSFVLTLDMTNYHVFRTIHPLTPAVILEMGYMLADRDVLENEPELLAQAITNGIYCYLGVSGSVSGLSPLRSDSRYLVPLLETPTPEWTR
ncbi:MAG: N-acetylmuramoyl-L-alanine amidase [Chloroflexi bacterium]|nr:N-acetylmuramoyl-L-alanine amidase [Chloroflexota bacterium]